mgnify:CR=1 FL=1|tara:strand:+ start:608 stop:2527 length:1920 start_codon:yes stop_codon:yes gene_type:complete
MCGVSGIINFSKNNLDLKFEASNLKKSLFHRGPDSSGHWIDDKNKILICHNRLSIIEMTNKGHQPMNSFRNKMIISFNGEIYNHMDLRKKISDKYDNWKSLSDTETLVNCFDILGIEKTLELTEGMFAICIYDLHKNKIYLIRDRFGEKPLYYGIQDGCFIFSSEVRGLENISFFEKKISKESINYFLKYSYIPTPRSVYEDIFKVDAGEILELDLNKKNISWKKKKWWSLKDKFLNNYSNKEAHQDYNLVKKDLDNKLNKSVKNQLLSDAPLGVFLSGGVDSSLISAIASKHKRNLNSFSVGFKNQNFNEAEYAKKIAKNIGTNHHEILLDEKKTLEIFDQIGDFLDEPFGDSSFLPSYFVSKFSSNNVKVVLTGDGADELFGGYNRYIWINKIWKYLNFLTHNQKKIFIQILEKIPRVLVNNFLSLINIFIYKKNKDLQLNNKIDKFFNKIKNSKNSKEFYLNLISTEFTFYNQQNDYMSEDLNMYELNDQIMYLDIKNYLKDDILTKVDRASMSASLETRAPFLSEDVFNISCGISNNFKVSGNTNKIILRDLLSDYVPKKLFDRPKMGFSIPLSIWLNTILKSRCEEFFDKKNLIKYMDIIDIDLLQKTWGRFKITGHNSDLIWNYLILLIWLDR